MKKLFLIFKKTAQQWSQDEAPQLAAALAYYAIFSLVPLILLLIFLLGFFLKDEVVQTQIIGFIQSNIGNDTAQTVQSMMGAFGQKTGSGWLQVLGFITLALGASGAVKQLQYAFNKIWNVERKPGAGVKAALKKQLLAFALIGLMGLLILASLLLSTTLALALNFLKDLFPWASYFLPLSDVLISFLILSLLFMLMFKYLPDVKLKWRDVWRGAFLTGLLFLLGKFALSWYFTVAKVASTYGAASSLLILLLWVYYSSLILLFGVEFTQVYTRETEAGIQPKQFTQFEKKEVVITPPGLIQKLWAVLKVLKVEVRLARLFLKVKKFFSKKKPKE